MAPLITSSPISSHPHAVTISTSNPAPSPPPEPTSSSSPPYEKPQPRPPRSPAHAAQIRVRNRRREWLSRNSSYFQSLEHELADPVLYDALVRRFQSHEQREQEGRAKGFGRVLEVDLLRGEARLSKLAKNDEPPSPPSRETRDDGGDNDDDVGDGFTTRIMDSADRQLTGSRSASSSSSSNPRRRQQQPPGSQHSESETDMNPEELETLETEDVEQQPVPQTAEEGRARWDEFLRRRFMVGGDEDFDYRAVDEDDEYDTLERREQEDAWFDNEEPGWVSESEDQEGNGDLKKKGVERPLMGETGVQDF
ncbi:coiled-coil domain-containing protein-domain-containing protein [Xylariaceae sp. FL1651]|nr:coiled-coil domain-containing protein-domain-containing protein [Xylariaceae sp. FL1651]